MIDLSRSAITVALGHWTVAAAAMFEAGTPVQMDSSGEIAVSSSGDNFFGVAKWNKTSVLYGIVQLEEVISASVLDVPVALAHANIVSGSVMCALASAPGTPLVEDTDYTMNYTNGTIAAKTGGAIAVDTAIVVSYRHALTPQEIDTERGANYQNLQDDSVGSGCMTVIQDYAIIYTDQYDTAKVYAAGGSAYVNAGGKFTSVAAGAVVGKIVQVPSASDPLLGIQIG